jgi:murein DD-endopeptidase MepM/ murein hydrolase activator NlpD
MRARTFAAFVIGFVVGIIVLAVGLWSAGGLNVSPKWAATPWLNRVRGVPPAAPVDTSMPNLASAPKQPPLVPPPSDLPQTVASAAQKANSPAPSSQGEAERSMPEAFPDRPMVPIAGVRPGSLSDTFNDARDGHRHGALDIPAQRGTPVLAAVEGNVAKLFNSKQGGLTVYQYDDSRNYCYYYAHLDRYAPGLKEGMLLRKGDVLGYVGSTGDAQANAPHLHFAVFRLGSDKAWWKGTAIDPLPLLQQQAKGAYTPSPTSSQTPPAAAR